MVSAETIKLFLRHGSDIGGFKLLSVSDTGRFVYRVGKYWIAMSDGKEIVGIALKSTSPETIPGPEKIFRENLFENRTDAQHAMESGSRKP